MSDLRYGANGCDVEPGALRVGAQNNSEDERYLYRFWSSIVFAVPLSLASLIPICLQMYMRGVVFPRMIQLNSEYGRRAILVIRNVQYYPIIMTVCWLPYMFIVAFSDPSTELAHHNYLLNLGYSVAWTALYPMFVCIYFFFRSAEARDNWRKKLGLQHASTVYDENAGNGAGEGDDSEDYSSSDEESCDASTSTHGGGDADIAMMADDLSNGPDAASVAKRDARAGAGELSCHTEVYNPAYCGAAGAAGAGAAGAAAGAAGAGAAGAAAGADVDPPQVDHIPRPHRHRKTSKAGQSSIVMQDKLLDRDNRASRTSTHAVNGPRQRAGSDRRNSSFSHSIDFVDDSALFELPEELKTAEGIEQLRKRSFVQDDREQEIELGERSNRSSSSRESRSTNRASRTGSISSSYGADSKMGRASAILREISSTLLRPSLSNSSICQTQSAQDISFNSNHIPPNGKIVTAAAVQEEE